MSAPRTRGSMASMAAQLACAVLMLAGTARSELTKSKRITVAQWHVPFLKECSDDLDASGAVLLKLLDLIETKCAKDLGTY